MIKKTIFLITASWISTVYANAPFEGKVVLVTGASKGIGKSIATTFAHQGAKVVLVSRTEADLKSVQDEIKKQGGEASYFVGDVGDEKAMENSIEFTKKIYGRLDVLCHNAGIYPLKRLEEMDSYQWQKVIHTNLTSTFYLVKAAIPELKKQPHGRIILISSTSGTVAGYPGLSHYTASKAGMVGFLKTTAIELAKYNITVNAVAPGSIFTEGLAGVPQSKLDKMRNVIPMKRLGKPEEIAHTVTFLASEQASFITGQNIVVDGGQTLPEIQTADF